MLKRLFHAGLKLFDARLLVAYQGKATKEDPWAMLCIAQQSHVTFNTLNSEGNSP